MKCIGFLHIRHKQSCGQVLLRIIGKFKHIASFKNQIYVFQNIYNHDAHRKKTQKSLVAVKSEQVIEPFQIPCLLNGILIHDNIDKRREDRDAQQFQQTAHNDCKQQHRYFFLIPFAENIAKLMRQALYSSVSHIIPLRLRINDNRAVPQMSFTEKAPGTDCCANRGR